MSTLYTVAQNAFQGFELHRFLIGGEAAALGQNTVTAAERYLRVLVHSFSAFQSSAILTNPHLQRTFKHINTGLFAYSLLSLGTDTGLIKIKETKLEVIKKTIDSSIGKIAKLMPAVVIIHAVALVALGHSLAPLAPLALLGMYGLSSLHHGQLLGESFREPLETLFSYMAISAGLFHPYVFVKTLTALSIAAKIYMHFNLPGDLTPIDALSQFSGKLTASLASDVLSGIFLPETISDEHSHIDPTPLLKGDESLHLLDDYEETFSSSQEALVRRAREHKDWKEWLEKTPNGTEKEFGKELLVKLINGIENESLPHAGGVSYAYIQRQLALINERIGSLASEKREEALLNLTFDAGNYCGEGVFTLVPAIADDVVLHTRTKDVHAVEGVFDSKILLTKVLILLQEFRYHRAAALFAEATVSSPAKEALELFGKANDPHRVNFFLRHLFAGFYLPKRGLPADAAMDDIPLLQAVCSNATNLMKKGFYDPSILRSWLENHFEVLQLDLQQWACESNAIRSAYESVKQVALTDENEMAFLTWVTLQLRDKEKRMAILNTYLLDIGVFAT